MAALRRLKKRFRLVAVTNAQCWVMAQFERTLEMPFDWPVTCDDTRRGKSDPRYFVRLSDMLARQGIERAEALDVAQSQFHDIRIAQALGWRTCWIERRAGMRGWGASQPEFKPVKPDWHFTTLRELADAVEAEAWSNGNARPCRCLPSAWPGFRVSEARDAAEPATTPWNAAVGQRNDVISGPPGSRLGP